MTQRQLGLFDPREGERLREDAINRVERGAPEDWMDRAEAAIRQLCREGSNFTTDEVWRSLNGEQPSEPRAMGAAMRRARLKGLCEATQQVVPSQRPGCHRRPVRVWRSLL